MQSWEEYIKSNIIHFREMLANFLESVHETNTIELEKFSSPLDKPCQVIMLDFKKPLMKTFIILNNQKNQDMETVIIEPLESDGFSLETLKAIDLLQRLEPDNIQDIFDLVWYDLEHIKTHSIPWNWSLTTQFLSTEGSMISFSKTPEEHELGDVFFSNIEPKIKASLREKTTKQIESTVDRLKRNAEAIPETIALKTEIMENVEKLGNEMDELRKRVDDEVGAMRKLVGKSENLLDWKMFSGDVDFLKKTHINREIFDSEIKRLEETTNARIDSMRDIKEAYDKVFSQQNKFMEQQAEVMKQQSSFINWIKYATILVPIAVVSVPIIEIVLRHILGIS